MAEFQPLRPERPPRSANGAASMCYSPADETLYLFVRGKSDLQVWGWNGGAWEKHASGLFEDVHSGRPLVACAKGDVHIFVATDSGFRVARLSNLDDADEIAAPRPSASHAHGFAGFNPQTESILICSPVSGESKTYAFDGSSFELVTIGPHLLSGCWDAANQRLVGIDVYNQTYYLGAGGWQSIELGLDRSGSDIAYDPRRGRIVRLMAESDDEMQLYAAGDNGLAEPLGPRMRPYIGRAALGIDPGRDQVLSVGGQDFRKAGDWSDETWVSTGGGDFESATSSEELSLSRYDTPVRMGDALLVVDHATLGVQRCESGEWKTVVEPLNDEQRYQLFGTPHDDRTVNFAASPRSILMLAPEGLFRARPGATWKRVAPGDRGPDARYPRRTAMAFDADTNRLVVFGGPDNNDTWLFDGDGWEELTPPRRPARGIASTAHTPDGIYLSAGRDLWRLDGDRWRCVGADDSFLPHGLLYDATHDALLTFDHDHPTAHLYTWTPEGWSPVASLPEGIRVRDTYGGPGAEVGIDGENGLLHLLHEDMHYALALGELDLSDALFPTDETEPIDATEEAPDAIKTTALAIEPTDEWVSLSELDVDLVVPDGWRLLALLPAHPAIEQLGAYSGLAVLLAEHYWETDYEPWRLGGGGLECRLLDGDPPPLAVASSDAPDGHLEFAEYRETIELSPDDLAEYHASDGSAPSAGTKLGGHPRYVQSDPLDGERDTTLQYVAQLGFDVYGSEFGDLGSAYVFVGPDGGADAVMQSH